MIHSTTRQTCLVRRNPGQTPWRDRASTNHRANPSPQAQLLIFLVLLISICPLQAVQAATRSFTLDAARSEVSISGTIAGFPLNPQGAGSLETRYEGEITADRRTGSIEITGGSVRAQDSGDWAPEAGGAPGSAPANYGAESAGVVNIPDVALPVTVNILTAIRNLEFVPRSDMQTVTGGVFPGSHIVLGTLDGDVDFSAVGTVLGGLVEVLNTNGTIALATNRLTNQSTQAATLTTSGQVETLVIPFDGQFAFSINASNDTQITLTGKWTATRILTPAPTLTGISPLQVQAQVTPGERYRWEFATQLEPPDWMPQGAIVQASNPLLPLNHVPLPVLRFVRLTLLDP